MRKMKLVLMLGCLAGLLLCNNQNWAKDVEGAKIFTECESVADTTVTKGRNDIRFAGWTDRDWTDNEYIRTVRKYIDAYNAGEIEDPDLDECREYIQGKFVIGKISPAILGGAFMYIIFYDYPDMTFSAWVYSDVNEETGVVSNYECRGLDNEGFDLGLSQEDILQFLKECPDQRMW